MLVEILILILTSILAYYWYVYKQIHNHFKERDVKFLPGVPIFGNVFKSTFLKRHMADDVDEVYRAFPDERKLEQSSGSKAMESSLDLGENKIISVDFTEGKQDNSLPMNAELQNVLPTYVGYIEGTKKIILIRDPELIKKITVKDFDHFLNHVNFFTEEMDPLFGHSLIMMKDEKWKDMRVTLTPAFTASKMKMMLPFLNEITNTVIEVLKEKIGQDINMDCVIRRFTTDVIASTAFGLEVNSLRNKDNEFYRQGQNLFNFTILQRIYFFLLDCFPGLRKYTNFRIRPTITTQFFRDIVTSTMEYREKNDVVRPDMIHLLMQARKGTLHSSNQPAEKDLGFATVQEETQQKGNVREWSEIEIVGQVFTFFVAGFETSASTINMCLHELVLNPEVQEKLYKEVKEFSETKGKLTYENINELKYLDCVLNETFRKWAVPVVLDRVCTKEYDLHPPHEGGKPYRVNPGDVLYNSVNAIHMDPKYYPVPHEFNPDRFSEENKQNIKPFTFMPFGMGPRACIGSRFALLELKILLFNLIKTFELVKSPKTIDPIKLLAKDFNIKAEGGTWLQLKLRA